MGRMASQAVAKSRVDTALSASRALNEFFSCGRYVAAEGVEAAILTRGK